MAAGKTPGKWPYRAAMPGRKKRVVKQKAREDADAGPRGVLGPEETARPWITPVQARVVVLAATLSVVMAGAWWMYHSPFLTVQNMNVAGATTVPVDDIENAAALYGDSTFSLDLAGAEARIEALPKVRDATVTKGGWDTVDITVEERVVWGSWKIGETHVPIDIDGQVLNGESAPWGSPVIVEVNAARALQPGDRIDPGAIELADRLIRESDTAFGRTVQAMLYRQSAGLTVVLAPSDVDGKPLWVTFGDSRDYDYKVAALYVLLQQAREQDLAVNVVDLRFGDRLVFN